MATTSTGWKARFDSEISMAEAARSDGNEGRARVCARRAVGIVIEAYLHQQDQALPGSSVQERINYVLTIPEIPTDIREVASHFLVKVNPDHTLPIEADLIADARWLAQTLMEAEDINEPKR